MKAVRVPRGRITLVRAARALLPVLLLAVLQICWLHSSSLHHPLALVPVLADGSQAEALPLRSFGLLSLRQALAAGVLTELRVHLGYGGRLGMWNAFPHIKAALTRAGYASTTAGYNNAAVMIVPNYWRPDAADWRRWRLAPYQRINRLWGMDSISRKESLLRTLNEHFGTTKCPFTPETYLLEEVRLSATFPELLATRREWLLKTAVHRGKGIRMVSSPVLHAAAALERRHARASGGANANEVADLRGWLRRHADDALLQAPISEPLLIDGRKVSLRLYGLITSANPLRVYLHREGFALLASHAFNSTSAGGALSFLTNAAVNRHSQSHSQQHQAAAAADDDGSTDDASVAASVGLTLPQQRWTLADFLRFVEARQAREAHARGQLVPRRGAVRRDLERLVLLTWVAAQPRLSSAAAQSMVALGLNGTHEWGTNFELSAFDVMLDAALRPWLLEVNTSPSLKEEEQGDLPLKLRVVGDMLSLAGVLPEQAEEPEAELGSLLRANQGAGGHGSIGTRGGPDDADCVRRWRLGGCRHCPSWAEVAQLWRAAAERRRAGGFVPLAPTDDREYVSLAAPPPPTPTAAASTVESRATTTTSTEAARPTADELLGAWLREGSRGVGVACTQVGAAREQQQQQHDGRTCIRRRWDAMLCHTGSRSVRTT